MRKLIIETLIGFVLMGLGIWTGNLYMSNFQNANPVTLSISIASLFLGIYILFKAGRRDTHIPHFKNSHQKLVGKSTLLEKNTELLKTYEKTSRMREKLRVIKRIG